MGCLAVGVIKTGQRKPISPSGTVNFLGGVKDETMEPRSFVKARQHRPRIESCSVSRERHAASAFLRRDPRSFCDKELTDNYRGIGWLVLFSPYDGRFRSLTPQPQTSHEGGSQQSGGTDDETAAPRYKLYPRGHRLTRGTFRSNFGSFFRH